MIKHWCTKKDVSSNYCIDYELTLFSDNFCCGISNLIVSATDGTIGYTYTRNISGSLLKNGEPFSTPDIIYLGDHAQIEIDSYYLDNTNWFQINTSILTGCPDYNECSGEIFNNIQNTINNFGP